MVDEECSACESSCWLLDPASLLVHRGHLLENLAQNLQVDCRWGKLILIWVVQLKILVDGVVGGGEFCW